MDDASYGHSSIVTKLGVEKHGKILDDMMSDSSGMVNPDSHLDSSMRIINRNEKDEREGTVADIGMQLVTSSTTENMPQPSKTCGDKTRGDLVVELQNMIEEKSTLTEAEVKLEAALEEVPKLARQLEMNQKLLDESQMNCAHLENCLHEARAEAQTHFCAADRRASEYNTLRGSVLRLHSLFERLKSCVSSAGVADFTDSLHALAQSLTNSANDNGDDCTADFRECVRVLAK